MKQLTDRQRQVFDFIVESIQLRQLPPTVREIGEKFGWSSTNAVADHLRALERKGYVIRDSLLSRGIRPTAEGLAATSTAAPVFEKCEGETHVAHVFSLMCAVHEAAGDMRVASSIMRGVA